MRRTAITLAVGIVLVEVAALVASELRLAQVLGGALEQNVWAVVSRVVIAAAWTLPWLVGAALLWRQRHAMGVVVIIATSLLTIPTAPFALQWILDVVDGVPVESTLLWIELVGGAVVWLLAIAAGVVAWLARPASMSRVAAPGQGNLYVILAFLAWLPSIMASTEFVAGPLGTELGARSFFEFLWTVSGGTGAVVGVIEAVVLGALLVVAPILRRDAAGALVLAVILPRLVIELQTIIEVLDQEFLISTPASIVGVIGMIGVAVIAVRWVVQGVPAEPQVATSDDEQTGAQ